MPRWLMLLLVLIAAPAAARTASQAPQPEWRQATEAQVLVRIGAFEPDPVRLVAGRPTRLVFYNASQTPLSVDAGEFFARALIRSGDADAVRGGRLEIRPGESREIVLVPAEGRYRVRSGSWLRRLLGMSAQIIVEPAPQRSVGRPIDPGL